MNQPPDNLPAHRAMFALTERLRITRIILRIIRRVSLDSDKRVHGSFESIQHVTTPTRRFIPPCLN